MSSISFSASICSAEIWTTTRDSKLSISKFCFHLKKKVTKIWIYTTGNIFQTPALVPEILRLMVGVLKRWWKHYQEKKGFCFLSLILVLVTLFFFQHRATRALSGPETLSPDIFDSLVLELSEVTDPCPQAPPRLQPCKYCLSQICPGGALKKRVWVGAGPSGLGGKYRKK